GAAAALVAGQNATGSIEGAVTESATHAPVKRAIVTTWSPEPLPSQPPERDGPITRMQPRAITAITDASGRYTLRSLRPGSYTLYVSHSRYPQFRGPASKTVEVKAGESVPVSFELTPGAIITGRVVDEDGDPLT